MKTVTQFPPPLVDRFESDRLFSQDFREVEQLATPLDLAVLTYLSDCDSRLILHLGEFGGIGAGRGAIDASRRLSSQRLMAALPVIFLQKRIVVALLLREIALRRHCFLQGSMHPLVTPVLSRFSRLNSLRLNSQLDPPFRELADAAQGQRGERRSVVGADHLGQSGLPKDPLKPRLHFLVPGSLKRATQKQIPREVVSDGQRITAAAVAQQKVALKVCTPTLIRGATLSKGFTIGSHAAPPLAGLNQTRTLQNFARRRIRRPLKFRPLMAQPVQNLFRAPLLAPKLGLHNQRSQLFRGLIGMTLRRASQLLKSLQPTLIITSDPLIDRRSTNPIASAKLVLAVVAAQPISYQLNSLIHGTGFLPRHRHPPPCRRNVNHVPGSFCKLCYRFVPLPNPLPKGEGEGLQTKSLFLHSDAARLAMWDRAQTKVRATPFFLGPTRNFTCLRIHAHQFAFLDEER